VKIESGSTIKPVAGSLVPPESNSSPSARHSGSIFQWKRRHPAPMPLVRPRRRLFENALLPIPRNFPNFDRRGCRAGRSQSRPHELHWHPNADEWQYYISGKARMTMFAAEAGTDIRLSDWRGRLCADVLEPFHREHRQRAAALSRTVQIATLHSRSADRCRPFTGRQLA
jgi:hypothetical protein